jgi:hypothetical protein
LFWGAISKNGNAHFVFSKHPSFLPLFFLVISGRYGGKKKEKK